MFKKLIAFAIVSLVLFEFGLNIADADVSFTNAGGAGAIGEQFSNGVVINSGVAPTSSNLCLVTGASGVSASFGSCGAGSNNLTPLSITWNQDGDQQLMGNTDLSKYHIGGVAQQIGGFWALLGSGADFVHEYGCHNISTNPVTFAFNAPDDPTSTSYCWGYTDAGNYVVYEAPAGAAMSTATLKYKIDLTTGAVAQGWLITAVSGVASTPSNLAVNTTSAPVSITLPASLVSATVTMLDYAGTFSAKHLTVIAPSGVPINGVSGSGVPATLTASTSWEKVVCIYLDQTIGYRCYQNSY